MNDIFKILKKLNIKAIRNGDVPVSAIITYNNKIIAKAYNMREYKKNPLYHAEILVIMKAAKKLNRWNLNGCVLYSTMKPCPMCLEVIKMSKIKNVYYFINNDKKINYSFNLKEIETGDKNYFIKEIQDFFADKR